MWRGGPDGGEGRRGAEATGVGAAVPPAMRGGRGGPGSGGADPDRREGEKGDRGEEWLRLGLWGG